MSAYLRYKIVLWMVWVQFALLPVVIIMISVANNRVMWRWNLLNWLMGEDTVGNLSPKGIKTFIENQKGGKR